ncbi:MAG: hypothetical protein IKN41_04910 [Candidatus Methanomethylophilaceae archaeon]|nr:hypothetical protein [Candidatus Methanomethylophilaceae archaeon]
MTPAPPPSFKDRILTNILSTRRAKKLDAIVHETYRSDWDNNLVSVRTRRVQGWLDELISEGKADVTRYGYVRCRL